MKLRAGTRKSPLAMAQTYMVLDMIKAAFPECDTEIVTFTTKGDRQLDRPLDKIGGKGVFVTEIEQALQSGNRLCSTQCKGLACYAGRGAGNIGSLPSWELS